jgi:hypothetical protein
LDNRRRLQPDDVQFSTYCREKLGEAAVPIIAKNNPGRGGRPEMASRAGGPR